MATRPPEPDIPPSGPVEPVEPVAPVPDDPVVEARRRRTRLRNASAANDNQ